MWAAATINSLGVGVEWTIVACLLLRPPCLCLKHGCKTSVNDTSTKVCGAVHGVIEALKELVPHKFHQFPEVLSQVVGQ